MIRKGCQFERWCRRVFVSKIRYRDSSNRRFQSAVVAGRPPHDAKLGRHPDTRTFEIKIKSPDVGLIFDGTASFTLTIRKLDGCSAKIGYFVEAQVVKGSRVAVLAAPTAPSDLNGGQIAAGR
jgi:hypothetical protein